MHLSITNSYGRPAHSLHRNRPQFHYMFNNHVCRVVSPLVKKIDKYLYYPASVVLFTIQFKSALYRYFPEFDPHYLYILFRCDVRRRQCCLVNFKEDCMFKLLINWPVQQTYISRIYLVHSVSCQFLILDFNISWF